MCEPAAGPLPCTLATGEPAACRTGTCKVGARQTHPLASQAASSETSSGATLQLRSAPHPSSPLLGTGTLHDQRPLQRQLLLPGGHTRL